MQKDNPESPSHRVLSLNEEVLSRIILDIHDGPVQYLFASLSLLTGIRDEVTESIPDSDLGARLAQVGMLLESSLYEIKFFMGTFRPPEFQHRSLVSILEGLLIQHEEWTGSTVHLRVVDDLADVTLPIKIALYRILQEALSNAYRHAGVDQHWVRLWSSEGYVCLEVVDEGCGFDLHTFEPPMGESFKGESAKGDITKHIGLRGMRDRVALLNGLFEIDSKLDEGTRITVKIPIAL